MSTNSAERKTVPVPLGDRSSNNPKTIREKCIPRPDSRRRRRRNPFSDGQRNNFPDLNDVFKSTTSSLPGPVCGDTEIVGYGGNTFDDGDDEECCQLSDIESSSVLNMSIGARAALNEHLRYVAKYGIDGEINVEAELNKSNPSSDETNSDACTNILLDDQWERILDLSRVASSIGGSVSEEIPSPPPNATTINVYFEGSSSEKGKLEESSSIEVMTDVSHDFFNSSRVNMLITPERNRNRRSEMVITRDGVVDFDNQNEESFLVSHGGQQRESKTDLQGSSFNLGDISRISSNTVSDVSFQNDVKQETRINDDANHDDGDDRFPFTSIFGMASPSVVLNNSSFLSSSGNNAEQKPTPNSKDSIESSEGASVGKSAQSSSSIQSAVSSFIAEACNFAKQVACDVEHSFEGMESLPTEFLRGIDIGQSDAPSPISQVCSSPSSSRQEASTKRQQRLTKLPSVDINNSENSIDKITRYNIVSSMTSPAESNAIQIHLAGRKRYRTVVPRRVYYLDLPAQECNEEQDSFIAVQSNPETTQLGRSLLESFDEAATSKSC